MAGHKAVGSTANDTLGRPSWFCVVIGGVWHHYERVTPFGISAAYERVGECGDVPDHGHVASRVPRRAHVA